jgi:hypothetical protein
MVQYGSACARRTPAVEPFGRPRSAIHAFGNDHLSAACTVVPTGSLSRTGAWSGLSAARGRSSEGWALLRIRSAVLVQRTGCERSFRQPGCPMRHADFFGDGRNVDAPMFGRARPARPAVRRPAPAPALAIAVAPADHRRARYPDQFRDLGVLREGDEPCLVALTRASSWGSPDRVACPRKGPPQVRLTTSGTRSSTDPWQTSVLGRATGESWTPRLARLRSLQARQSCFLLLGRIPCRLGRVSFREA